MGLLTVLLVGCSSPHVEVSVLGGGATSLVRKTPTTLDEFLNVAAEFGPAVDDSAWPRCTTANGSHALRAHPDAVRKALAPSQRGHRVLVTEMPIAIDRPGAPCTRVFGAAPPGSGVVLVSARELRQRCSSMPVDELVARVAAHELGHVMEVTRESPGVNCDRRGCHCATPNCLMADGRGGCPQPDIVLCARCIEHLDGPPR
jgi:hypothetical protein